MPEPQEWGWSDSFTDLWRKIARNWYDIAVTAGFSESLEPLATDTMMDSARKVTVYTAFVAENT